VDFWFGGSEFGEDAAEAERVFAGCMLLILKVAG
jgi:hypothetical protein